MQNPTDENNVKKEEVAKVNVAAPVIPPNAAAAQVPGRGGRKPQRGGGGRPQRGGGRGQGRGGASEDGLIEKVVVIKRVAKVVKGGHDPSYPWFSV